MKRREFITLLGSAAAWPLAARAQQRERMRRIGIVMPYAKGDSEVEPCVRAFKQELAKLGWTEGGNVQFEEHWTTDNMDMVRAHAASLVASNPDIIVATGGRVSLFLCGCVVRSRGCSPARAIRSAWQACSRRALDFDSEQFRFSAGPAADSVVD
jgi:hypothetical protein